MSTKQRLTDAATISMGISFCCFSIALWLENGALAMTGVCFFIASIVCAELRDSRTNTED